MSCQEAVLAQEDPYIFTETPSSNLEKVSHGDTQMMTTKYVPLVRSSQPNQTNYDDQTSKHSQHPLSSRKFVMTNGLQQSKLLQKVQHQTMNPIQLSANLENTQIMKPNNKSSSSSISASFKVPQTFVQQSQKKQNQPAVECSVTNNLMYSINNQPHSTSNSTTMSQNQKLNISGPLIKTYSPQTQQPFISTTTTLPAVLSTGSTIESELEKNVGKPLKLHSLNFHQSIHTEHNFNRFKMDSDNSNDKIVYTIPLTNSSSKISIINNKNSTPSKVPCIKRKNISNNELQVTTSKDGKTVMMPLKVAKGNGLKQFSSENSAPNNVRNKKILKELSSDLKNAFTECKTPNQKSSNVVTASVSDLTSEWHAPDSYIFDYTGPERNNLCDFDLSSFTQQHWFFLNSHSALSSDPMSKSSFGLYSGLNYEKCDNILSTKQKTCKSTIPSKLLDTVSMPYDLCSTNMTRDQRIKIKKSNLRRQTVQYWNAQTLRCTKLAQQRLIAVAKILHKLNLTKDELFSKQSKNCTVASCSNEAIILTAFCFQHILNNKDQKLFHSCTAKFSDNTQCRIPVYDISHDLPLCREHALKRDNYQRMSQEQRPRNLTRKKQKLSAMIRPGKRNKKKRKFLLPTANSIKSSSQIKTVIYPNSNLHGIHYQQPQSKQHQPQQIQQLQQQLRFTGHEKDNQFIYQNSGDLMALASSAVNAQHLNVHPTIHLTYKTDDMILNKIVGESSGSLHENTDIQLNNHEYDQNVSRNEEISMFKNQMGTLSTCENSYESSEDAGVGVLSESDLIERDWLEMKHHNDKLLEQDLTHVLNQLPIGELEDIFEPQHVQSALIEDFESQIETDPINYFDEMLREDGEVVLNEELEHSEDESNHHHNHHFSKMSANELQQARLRHDQQQILSAAANLLNMSSSISHAAAAQINNHHNQDVMSSNGNTLQQQQELRELVHT